MVFPKYRNDGHGAELTDCVYRDIYQNQEVIDCTAEAPSPDFVRLRDYITTKMCCTLPAFKDKEALKKGFNSEMATEALKHFKIPKLQSRRCYEILRMACTNQNSTEEWTSFRLDVKKRFYKPFLNKSKYARKARGPIPENEDEEGGDGGTSSGMKAFENRFGGLSSKFGAIEEEEEEESESGVTTIGFGGKSASKLNSKPIKSVSFGSRMEPQSTTQIGFDKLNRMEPESTTQIGFGNPSVPPKSVSFSTDVTTVNTSDTKMESENGEEENTEDKAQENLFMTEKQKKEYLESEFQSTVDDYAKIIKRLENANVL